MRTTVGIDLGTSHVVAAVSLGAEARALRNQEGATSTPAIVCRVGGEWHVGQPAKRLAVLHPQETAWDFVRLLGRRFDSPEVRNAASLAPFAVVEGPRGDACLRLGAETVHPVALVAILLAKLKMAAEAETGGALERCVVAVPAPFHSGQRALVKEAGRFAGFAEVRVTTSTSAAALSLGAAERSERRVAAICDLGGGSFGVALVELAADKIRVLARESEAFLGGEDFDQLVVRWLLEELHRKEGVDGAIDPAALAHAKEVAERAKHRLSVLSEVDIDLPLGGGVFSTTLARAQLEAMLEPQLEWLAAPCARALKSANLERDGVDAVLPFGGSTRIPRVLQRVERIFGKEPTAALHPEEAAAHGAAILGARLADGDPDGSLLDVLSHDVGIEYPRAGFAPIVSRGEPLPAKKSRAFMTSESRLEIRVLEGTGALSGERNYLGRIVWELPFRAKETAVEIHAEIDRNGGARFTAVDPASGVSNRVPLRGGPALSAAEEEWIRREVDRFRASLESNRSGSATGKRSLASLATQEKVVAALNGDREQRFALVRDPDRSVWAAVLESPRTTAEEMADILALPGLDPAVLREIGSNPEWCKRYDVALGLVNNPATPLEVAMQLVNRLRTPDLERILVSDVASEELKGQCRSLMKMRI